MNGLTRRLPLHTLWSAIGGLCTNLKLRTKLVLAMLGAGVLPLLASSLVMNGQAGSAREAQPHQHLDSLVPARPRAPEEDVDIIRHPA
ncbi:MAG: hypothetical protein RLW61_15965, partial [Gammaproteobacteria bacterium]